MPKKVLLQEDYGDARDLCGAVVETVVAAVGVEYYGEILFPS
jgi:hypothetical protein